MYMESDTFYGDFIEKLTWRLSGNLVYHDLYMKTSDTFLINFTVESITVYIVSTQSP